MAYRMIDADKPNHVAQKMLITVTPERDFAATCPVCEGVHPAQRQTGGSRTVRCLERLQGDFSERPRDSSADLCPAGQSPVRPFAVFLPKERGVRG